LLVDSHLPSLPTSLC